jgi:NNP family nitrate/nitrite transporter-like MFS transporter
MTPPTLGVKGNDSMARARHISHWDPEDVIGWETGNNVIARRNLIWSIVNMHVGFSIWTLWSVMVLFMPQAVYGFTAGDKLLLGAIAMLVGACVRIPYVMATARFGGRNWAIFSSLVLLIPTLGAVVLLANPGLPLWPYLVCAALTGLGGGNYSASLANVEAFYPQRRKGLALGLTGGLGNLGVAGIQAVGLVVLATAGNDSPYWVCAIYLVLLAIAGLGASLFMDNLANVIKVSHVWSVLKVPDAWGIAFLYMCASGSFIGFAFAFGQVIQLNLLAGGETHAQATLHAAEIAFIGPLLGSAARILGGRLGDRYGGGRVTLSVVAGMILGAGLLVAVSTRDDLTRGPGDQTPGITMIGYVIGFIALFIFCGMGKGAVFKLIPSIFEQRSHSLPRGESERRQWARTMSGSLIGFAGAFGGLGGVGIDLALRQSYVSSGTETPAFWSFLACYLVAAVLTWTRYVRPRRTLVQAPAHRDVAAGQRSLEASVKVVAGEPVRT